MPSPRKQVPQRVEVLQRVEQALAQALAKTDERAGALAAAVPPAGARLPDFDGFQSRLAELASCPEKVAAGFGELDRELQQCEDALRQWLARAEATRRQLAGGVGRAVG
jgi:hypothetical protein